MARRAGWAYRCSEDSPIPSRAFAPLERAVPVIVFPDRTPSVVTSNSSTCRLRLSKRSTTVLWTLALPSLSACSSSLDFESSARAAVETRYEPESRLSIVDTLIYGADSGAYELELAGYEFMSDCVEEAGFDWTAARPTQALIAADTTPIIDSLSVDEAMTSGYGFAEPLAPHLAYDPVGAYADGLTSSQSPAFFDVVERCRAESRDLLFEDSLAYEANRELLESARIEFYDAFDAAMPVRELRDEWASCMSGAGHEVDTIEDAVRLASATDSVAEQGRSADPATEFTIAVADARCRAQTAYEDQFIDLFRRAEANFVEENEDLILTVRDLRYGGQQKGTTP